MLIKLIIGFGWSTEHYVGEEPKGEANCWAEKEPLFRSLCKSVEVQKYMQQLTEREQQALHYGRLLYPFTILQMLVIICHYKCNMSWRDSTLCLCVDSNALSWQREVKWSMHRWYLESSAVAFVCLSARGYQENFCWLVPRLRENESKAGGTLSGYPGGRDHPRRSWACWEPRGERATLWCLQGRPHPAAALQATRCLARAGHRWRSVCVNADSRICQVRVQGAEMFQWGRGRWTCLLLFLIRRLPSKDS